ncbi:MAG TPA: diacylglycerol kinase [Gammaproteobacteria bacterium]|nr:diacylglycerol kinase [Gammaproteobacteria bacterium]
MDEPPLNKPDHRGLVHVWRAFQYSVQGLRAAWRYEEAFRLELLACVLMIPLGIWLGRSAVEYALLFSSLLLVLIVELVNSAIEAIVDRIGVEQHKLSGRAKDIGSAAVFLSLFYVAVVWGSLLLGRLTES